jgi:Na+-translocating ferredoxin:NAD+ oxidoreductase RnfG subunit
MSEIKGQLLGIVLVLMVFAAVSTIMVTTFQNVSKKVSSEVSEIMENADVNVTNMYHFN